MRNLTVIAMLDLLGTAERVAWQREAELHVIVDGSLHNHLPGHPLLGHAGPGGFYSARSVQVLRRGPEGTFPRREEDCERDP